VITEADRPAPVPKTASNAGGWLAQMDDAGPARTTDHDDYARQSGRVGAGAALSGARGNQVIGDWRTARFDITCRVSATAASNATKVQTPGHPKSE
jgi:hypothetical protein